MTTNYKILGQTAPTAATETLNYVVPSSTSTLVRSINITNTSATADTYSLAIAPKNLFVGVSYYGTSATSSTDGITWTLTTLPVSFIARSATYGKNTFVAIQADSTTALYSTNGITWNTTTIPSDGEFGYWRSVAFGNNVFVAVANNTSVSATSTDGITWTQRSMPSSSNWYPVAYGNNTFVALTTSSTTAATSTDGITWTTRTLPVMLSKCSMTLALNV
jgi:hypothetical protein